MNNTHYKEIDRDKVAKRIEELSEIDFTQKGMQPELVLGCFYELSVNNNSICKKCGFYENKCRSFLEPFEK